MGRALAIAEAQGTWQGLGMADWVGGDNWPGFTGTLGLSGGLGERPHSPREGSFPTQILTPALLSYRESVGVTILFQAGNLVLKSDALAPLCTGGVILCQAPNFSELKLLSLRRETNKGTSFILL